MKIVKQSLLVITILIILMYIAIIYLTTTTIFFFYPRNRRKYYFDFNYWCLIVPILSFIFSIKTEEEQISKKHTKVTALLTVVILILYLNVNAYRIER